MGDQIERNEIGGTCITYGGEERCLRVLVGKPEGKNHLEVPDVDGRIILKWIFRKLDGAWTGLNCLRIGTGGGQL